MYAPQIYNILCFEHGNRRSIKYVGLDFLLHRHKKRRFLCKFASKEARERILYANFIQVDRDIKELISEVFNIENGK